MLLALTPTGQAAVLDPARPRLTPPPLPRVLFLALRLKEGMKEAVQGAALPAQRLNIFYLN